MTQYPVTIYIRTIEYTVTELCDWECAGPCGEHEQQVAVCYASRIGDEVYCPSCAMKLQDKARAQA